MIFSVKKVSFPAKTANHQYNFVDPNTGVTTNHVEAMWQRAKAKFKSMFDPTNRDMVPDYILSRVHVEPEVQGTFLFPLLDSSYPTVPCMNSMVKNGFSKSHK